MPNASTSLFVGEAHMSPGQGWSYELRFSDTGSGCGCSAEIRHGGTVMCVLGAGTLHPTPSVAGDAMRARCDQWVADWIARHPAPASTAAGPRR